MWEQFEMEALNKASRAHYKLIVERTQLVDRIYHVTGNKRNASLQKISEIDEQLQELKTDMKQRRQNMLCLQAF